MGNIKPAEDVYTPLVPGYTTLPITPGGGGGGTTSPSSPGSPGAAAGNNAFQPIGGPAQAGGGPGLLGGVVPPYIPNPTIGAGNQQNFLQALWNAVMGKQGLQGLPGYGGQLYPNLGNTMLPNVWGSWSPQNAGTQQLGQNMMNYNQPNPMMAQYMSNMLQFGGQGWPTQLMHNMAQYGGTGGPGNLGMVSALQTGAPSAAGRNVEQMAQTGVAGSWGNPLLALSQGQGPAMGFLAPFLANSTNTPGANPQYLQSFLGAKPYKPGQ